MNKSRPRIETAQNVLKKIEAAASIQENTVFIKVYSLNQKRYSRVLILSARKINGLQQLETARLVSKLFTKDVSGQHMEQVLTFELTVVSIRFLTQKFYCD